MWGCELCACASHGSLLSTALHNVVEFDVVVTSLAIYRILCTVPQCSCKRLVTVAIRWKPNCWTISMLVLDHFDILHTARLQTHYYFLDCTVRYYRFRVHHNEHPSKLHWNSPQHNSGMQTRIVILKPPIGARLKSRWFILSNGWD